MLLQESGIRKVMVVVDSRATWSRAKTVCEEIQKRKDLELQLTLVGPLASSNGHPFEGVSVTGRIPDYNPSDTMSQTVGYLIHDLGKRIQLFHPDVVISVTDRYESLAVAVAASLSNVHLAHIQGGEVSGSTDESMRHAITKLSHIHFPANQDSADRIERMGEDPRFIFNVGCPATDLLLKVDVGIQHRTNSYAMVSYNPVTTLSDEENYNHMLVTLRACLDTQLELVIVGPNHDPGSEGVWNAIRDAGTNSRPLWTDPTLPHSEFISLMAHASVLVGNSSAGIREACYFGTPVVNVGTRQFLRARSKNIITVHVPTMGRIKQAIEAQIEHGPYDVERPYGNGGAGKKIAEILATIELPPIQKTIRY